MSFVEKIRQAVSKWTREQAPIDPSVFGDPVATSTKWTPLVGGGASFGTHRLVTLEEGRLAMKKSLGAFAFGGLFIVVGVGIAAAGIVGSQWVPVLIGAIFAGCGCLVAWPTSLIFDANLRQVRLRAGPVSFSNIHAVQIVKEYVRGNKRSYWSYELNLVLKNGERVHVVDHGNLEGIRGDSQRLGALMSCKVWDATR